MTEYAIADYVDFEIHVKHTGNKNRSFATGIQQIQTKYARKEKMAENGQLSDEASKQLGTQKMKDLAGLYADNVIVGWKGKYNGKKLPEFTREACIELFSNPDNDTLFADIIDFALEQSNFADKVQKAEIKN